MGYPGGKSGAGVFQTIINLMPPHEVYVEPFLGGGAIMLAKRPALRNLGFDLVGSSVSAVAAAIVDSGGGSSFGNCLSETGDDGSSALVISGGPAGVDPIGALDDTRRHSSPAAAGEYSIAVHGPLQTAIPPAVSFRLTVGDGLAFLESSPVMTRAGALVYCDPPYLMSTRSGGRQYAHEFPAIAHRRMLRAIRKADCMVMVSGYDSDLYRRELAEWDSVSYQTMSRGGVRTEWLWFNFPRPLALHDYRFLGSNFRERERIQRKKRRWVKRLGGMPILERQALLSAIADTTAFGDPSRIASYGGPTRGVLS